MKASGFFLIIMAVLFQACALVDGYKDNQHSWWSKTLPASVKARVDNGEWVEMELSEKDQAGRLIVLKGDPEYGPYNFVERGEWEESFEYEGSGIKRGDAKIKTLYDLYGNTVSRTVTIKGTKDTDFYINQIVSSRLQVFKEDTVFTQEIKVFNPQGKLVRQYETATPGYHQMLSDRLKKKIMIGREVVYDDQGNLKKETHYRYEDQVNAN